MSFSGVAITSYLEGRIERPIEGVCGFADQWLGRMLRRRIAVLC